MRQIVLFPVMALAFPFKRSCRRPTNLRAQKEKKTRPSFFHFLRGVRVPTEIPTHLGLGVQTPTFSSTRHPTSDIGMIPCLSCQWLLPRRCFLFRGSTGTDPLYIPNGHFATYALAAQGGYWDLVYSNSMIDWSIRRPACLVAKHHRICMRTLWTRISVGQVSFMKRGCLVHQLRVLLRDHWKLSPRR